MFNITLRFIKINKLALLLIMICSCVIYLYANHVLVNNSIFSIFLPTKYTNSSDKNGILKNLEKRTEEIESFVLKSMFWHPQFNNAAFNNSLQLETNNNVFIIYARANCQVQIKFELFLRSLLKDLSIGIHLHIIIDKSSELSIEENLKKQMKYFRRPLRYTLYNIRACTLMINDIVNAMAPHFSTTSNSYYSDSLYYLSLGLHRIASVNIKRAILLDCDIVLRSDIRFLFDEFNKFSDGNLFGLAPELTPVYRHILYRYRANYPNTNFGDPYYLPELNRSARLLKRHRKQTTMHGYPGLNSGVVLLNLERLRESGNYGEHLKITSVNRLTSKYEFRGHLGDQDFFTLLGFEYPNLLYKLDCIWNRQLCTWYKDHGYSEIYDSYFYCEGQVRMYHGNCNTRFPE